MISLDGKRSLEITSPQWGYQFEQKNKFLIAEEPLCPQGDMFRTTLFPKIRGKHFQPKILQCCGNS